MKTQSLYTSFVGKLLALIVLALFAWGNVWAETISSNTTYSGTETITGDVTIEAGVTVTVTGNLTITGNLINNGGTLIIDGGKLDVKGNFTNNSVAGAVGALSAWTNGTVTYEYYKNKDYAEQGNESSSYRISSTPQTATSSQEVVQGTVSVLNGNLNVAGTLTNSGNISVTTTNQTKISRITTGTLNNAKVSVSYGEYTYLRAKKQKQKKNNRGNWNNDGDVYYDPNEAGNKTTSSQNKDVSGSITLDNGYLVVEKNMTLEDGSVVSYKNPSVSGLKGIVDGEDVDVQSTIVVEKNLTQAENASITYSSSSGGTMIVMGTYTDNTTESNNSKHPWTIKGGESSIDAGFKISTSNYIFDGFEVEVDYIDSVIEELENTLNAIVDENGIGILDEYLKLVYPDDYTKYTTEHKYIIWSDQGTYESYYGSFSKFLYKEGISSWDRFWEAIFSYSNQEAFEAKLSTDMENKLIALRTEIAGNKALKTKIKNLEKELRTAGINKSGIADDISTISSLLPISLTSFSASQIEDEIEIAWTTNSEVNNDYFTVEYSIDGVSFNTLETVAGSGTTSEVNEYAITTQASQFNGVVYFRLKQTDYNGEYSYSDVITLAVESSNELYVYPNPATEFVSVSGTYKSAVVQDMFGKKVAVATNDEQIFVGNLSAGTYYVVVATENGKKVLPFVKE